MREFLELTADIVSSRTEQEIMQKMEAAAHALHCDQVLFGIEVRQPLSPVIQSVTSCYPQRYQELYWEQGFVARDPVVAHCQSRTDPIRWSESMYDANSFDIMEESKAHGLAHGFSIPVRESGLDPITRTGMRLILKRSRVQGFPRRRSALATNRPTRWETRVRGRGRCPRHASPRI